MVSTSSSGQSVGQSDKAALDHAFAGFTTAAHSLERTYGQLQAEVQRLRQELEHSRSRLSESLEATQQAQRRLHDILQALPCAVMVMDVDRRLSLSNPTADSLLGFSSRQGDRQLLSALCAATDGSAAELEWSGPDGAHWIAVHRAEVPGGTAGEVVLIAQDLTRLKRLERETEGLRQSNALNEMATVLAHEVRNPLAAMELFAGILDGGNLDDQQRDCVQNLRAGIRALSATVDNVLQFHSRSAPRRVRFEAAQMIESVCSFLLPLAEQSRVRLRVRCQAGLELCADQHRVRQVLYNLALNAIRYMPQGGVLTFDASRTPAGRITISASDTGPGVAEADRERIFDVGFTTQSGRAGLGLAVCKTVMERHGGSIRVANAPGGGARFVLEFSA